MTEQELKEMVILPRDPVAYPVHPKRVGVMRRPMFRLMDEEMAEAGNEKPRSRHRNLGRSL